jgi:hypothetical protein
MSNIAIGLAFVDDDIRQRRLPIATGTVWKSGALLVPAAGLWTECGADPAVIGGVSLDEVGDGSGILVPIGRREFPPYTCGGLLVTEDILFSGPYVGTPALGLFGVTKGADGIWRVDFAKTGGTARVRVIDIDGTTEPFLVLPGDGNSPLRYNGVAITGPVPVGFVNFVFLTANTVAV